MTPADFCRTGVFFSAWDIRPVGIDILTQLDGADFDAAWEKRVEGVVAVESGLKTNFISRDDFIATKIASGRPQDLADVAAVREADKQRALEEIAKRFKIGR